MDEYEKLEAELKKVYEEYIVKFRCLTFLEQQVREKMMENYNREKKYICAKG